MKTNTLITHSKGQSQRARFITSFSTEFPLISILQKEKKLLLSFSYFTSHSIPEPSLLKTPVTASLEAADQNGDTRLHQSRSMEKCWFYNYNSVYNQVIKGIRTVAQMWLWLGSKENQTVHLLQFSQTGQRICNLKVLKKDLTWQILHICSHAESRFKYIYTCMCVCTYVYPGQQGAVSSQPCPS